MGDLHEDAVHVSGDPVMRSSDGSCRFALAVDTLTVALTTPGGSPRFDLPPIASAQHRSVIVDALLQAKNARARL